MFQSGCMLDRNRISAPGRSGNTKRNSRSSCASGLRPPTMWRTCSLASSSWVRSIVAKPRASNSAAIADGLAAVADRQPDEHVGARRAGDAVVELGDRSWRRPAPRTGGSCRSCSGIVTANSASRSSARSATNRSRSKFMFAPQAIGDQRRARRAGGVPRSCLRPAMLSAPAGSRMLRVSWKTSLMAAQTASVSTTTKSSTSSRTSRNVSSPTSFTAVPSENRPTSSSWTRWPAASERAMASESSIWTPMTCDLGSDGLDVRGDAGDQPAAADRDEDGVDRSAGAGAGSPSRSCPGRRSRRGRRTGG